MAFFAEFVSDICGQPGTQFGPERLIAHYPLLLQSFKSSLDVICSYDAMQIAQCDCHHVTSSISQPDAADTLPHHSLLSHVCPAEHRAPDQAAFLDQLCQSDPTVAAECTVLATQDICSHKRRLKGKGGRRCQTGSLFERMQLVASTSRYKPFL